MDVRLGIEELEQRVNPGGSGGISVALDNYEPKTNDLLTATVTTSYQGPIVFRYDWKVNGEIVQTNQTANYTDTFDLSQPGNGDKNDNVEIFVTLLDSQQTAEDEANVINSAPVITPFADMIFIEGDEVYIALAAIDADFDNLSFSAMDLPDGLSLTDNYNGTAVISGVLGHHDGEEPTKQFPVRIIVTDGTDNDEANPFCQATNFAISTLAIDAVPAGNSWAAPVILPANHSQMNFTFTATGVGARGGTEWYWTVFEHDFLFNDLMWSEETATTPPGAGNNGAWSMQVTFYLFLTQPNNYVAGPYENSGETNPDIIKVKGEGFYGGDWRTSSNGIFVAMATPP